jgi:purine-binding chemotaxis protein CheW
MKDGTTTPAPDAACSWEHIHMLFANVRKTLENLQQPDGSSGEDVLRRRAELYANGLPLQGDGTGERSDVLQFSLGNDTYAIPCSQIEEVIPMQNLVALPHTGKPILGISSNRGLLFVVVDLKRILNIPASDLTTMHRLVIVRHTEFQVGLLVDVVQGMRGIRMEQLRELPGEMNPATRRFLGGITADRVLLLEMDAIVAEIAGFGESRQAENAGHQFEQHRQVQL